MANNDPFSSCAAALRQFDPDRYLTALFAPPARRDALFALYAFNLEIARIPEATSEPLIGEIRLQWWRDALAGAYEGATPRHHGVAEPLHRTIAAHGPSQCHFDRLLDARSFDQARRPPATLAELEAYAKATSGGLQLLALEILGVRANPDAERAASEIGTAWALTGLLRAVPFHGRAGRLYLPDDLLAAAGSSAATLPLDRGSPAMAAVAARLAEAARAALERGREKGDLPSEAHPALLLGALADRYLARLASARYDLFDARMARPLPFREVRLWLRARKGKY